jgi:hypothetical protein
VDVPPRSDNKGGEITRDERRFSHPAQCFFAAAPIRLVPENRLYKVHKNGEPIDNVGPFEDEGALIDALIQINRSTQLQWGTVIVHVYETDATPLGIGRKYLGSIDGGTVLMMGEVDEERVRT